MRKMYNIWRYYGIGHEEYKIYMGILSPKIIIDIIKANILVAALTAFFAVFPVLTENNFQKSGFYIEAAVIAVILLSFSVYKYKHYKNKKNISNWIIYLLLFLTYANIMFIGLYLAVWASPAKIAGSFVGILICALLPFTISPILYLCLTIGTVAFYIILILEFKIPAVWNYDIQNALFAGIVSIVFGWHFTMHRITSAMNISKLETENTIDALTQLKNRRDFMQTFQRYVSHNRPSDKYLCVALLDIDCFKNYNDHYGHPQGDECLRKIGRVLKDLHINKGIYTARIGGEEFALLWHIENYSDANDAGLNISRIIRDLYIPHEKSIAAPYITVSIGIHIAQCGISHDINDLYNLADKSLYNAKNNGRNCVIVSS